MKNSIIFLSAILLFSCTAKESNELDNIPEKNIAIAKKVYEAFNKHNWEEMANLYSETADFKDPSLGKEPITQTRKQTIEKYSDLAKTFPDVKDEIVSIYPSGNQHVIVEFVSSGTAPDGEKWTLPICTIFTIQSGVIVKDFTYYDN